MSSFFSNVKYSWNQYTYLREKYLNQVPIPQQSYFKPIHSIDKCATLIVRPIYSPLWLGVNTLLFFLKSMLDLITTLLLVVPALLLAIFAPNSQISHSTCSVFKQAAANTVVDATMTLISACATLASIVFNPIYLLTRCVSTVVERTDSCCDLTIARF